ncbi:MAG: hypothetical protein ACUVQH_00125 [Thermogutta sp.]
MRQHLLSKVASLVGMFLLCGGFHSGAFAQGVSSSEESASAAPIAQSDYVGQGQPCGTYASCCYCFHWGGHEGCLARYMSSVGGFNCSCRGSYKFPVPPQYTYHWPGVYSQQAMTSYQSPYRYPLLRLPPWMEKKANGGLPEGKDAVPLMPSPGERQPESQPAG